MGDTKWRDTLLDEIKSGGKESPCPRCGLPRVRRSDYIRCSACALNWGDDERLDINQDPRPQRLKAYLEKVQMTQSAKTSKPGDAPWKK